MQVVLYICIMFFLSWACDVYRFSSQFSRNDFAGVLSGEVSARLFYDSKRVSYYLRQPFSGSPVYYIPGLEGFHIINIRI